MNRYAITTLSAALLGAILASPSIAQVKAYGGVGDRKAATVVFFASGPLGMTCIQYGQPEWKDEYNALIAGGMKGKSVRLGKDFWTTLDTTMDLTISGQRIPAGNYYLALHCDDVGKFHLGLMDPRKAIEKQIMPFVAPSYQLDLTAPLAVGKADAMHDKLTIDLPANPEDPSKLTLKVSWGKHELSAPVIAHLKMSGTLEAAGKKKGN